MWSSENLGPGPAKMLRLRPGARHNSEGVRHSEAAEGGQREPGGADEERPLHSTQGAASGGRTTGLCSLGPGVTKLLRLKVSAPAE